VSAEDFKRLTNQSNPEHEYTTSTKPNSYQASSLSELYVAIALISEPAALKKKTFVSEVSDANKPKRVVIVHGHLQEVSLRWSPTTNC
jgi:hypothetical protein